MRSVRWVLGLLLGCVCTAAAQPLLDRETLARIPLDEAMVLDPVGPWRSWHNADDSLCSQTVGLDQESGFPRMVVAEPGKYGLWHRTLGVPVDLQRYPILVVAYRASGLQVSDRALLELRRRGQPGLPVLDSRELVADGEVHEIVQDLRDDVNAQTTEVVSISVKPRCQGPDPAVFELLGLRFESDHQFPPVEQTEEAEITVQAVDLEARPVVGATVTAEPGWLNLARTATTDAEGKATLAVANTPGAAHSLRLTKSGMAITEIATDKEGHLAPTAELLPGIRYGGVVRNEANEPVPNAAVDLAYDTTVHSVRWTTATVLTDAEGHWTAPILPSAGGSLQIRLLHPDYAPQTVKNLPLAELNEQRAVLVLYRGSHLAVQVLGPDGKPVPGAKISWSKGGYSSALGKGTTDADGRFTSPQALHERLHVTVEAEGLAPAQETVEGGPDQAELTVRLEPGGVIQGRVVDVAGQPVAGVRVAAGRWRRSETLSWNATTDAAGRFLWFGVPREDEVEVNLTKTGYLQLYGYRLHATDEEHTIVLPSPLVIQGTITDAQTGKPVPDCTLVPGTYWAQDGVPLERSTFWETTDRQRVTGGHYRLTKDACNASQGLVLRVEADGYQPARSEVLRIDGGEQVCDFQLHKGTSITGTVRCPDGQPAAGAKMYLVEVGKTLFLADGMVPREWAGKTATTGPDGRYELPPAVGDWLLVAIHADGYGELTTAAWAQAPDLPLQPWARIEGTCYLGANRRPDTPVNFSLSRLDSFGLRLNGASNAPRVQCIPRTRTDADGHFVFPRVAPGEGQISSGDVGTEPHSPIPERWTRVKLPAGKTLRVTFGGSGRPVVGRIVLPTRDGAPIAWSGVDGTLYPSVRVDPPQPERPPFLDESSEEARKRAQEWIKTADGKAYGEAMMRHQKARSKAMANVDNWGCRFRVAKDGSFRIEDVPAGYYKLHVCFTAADGPDLRVKTVAGTVMEFEIPETPGGRSDEPFDLGTIQARDTGQ